MTNGTLWKAAVHKKYIVEAILIEDLLARRLEALGINEGTPIEIMTRKRSGAMVVKVRGTRLALGKHISSNIEVREEAVNE